MKKAVIYARHLTYRDYEPNIDEQNAICKDFAVKRNIEIIGFYSDCFHEKNMEYPAFENMTNLCNNKRKNKPFEFDGIIIYSKAALGRNCRKSISWINKLNKKGIEVYFVSDNELNSELSILVKLFNEYIKKGEKDKMKTAVIYARYSSDSQSEQSIEGQLRVCQQYAKNNDILILDTYIDRAMTGINDARPDFQRMIKDSNKRQWDYVIVYKLDRFSRNKYEATIHKHTLRENGVKLLSAMENIPDTPEGIILESLLEGMNQYYSAELSQKVLRGLKESYIKGHVTGGKRTYGYNIVNKKAVINEFEADIIREIFTKFANGQTGKSIADNLIERGIRTDSGHYIDAKRLYKFIENSKYVGRVKHGDTIYTNIYPAIVDEDTWNKVQTIRNSNKFAPGRKKEMFDFILTGKLVCGHCHHLMIGESGTSANGEIYYYYNCMSRRKKRAKCEFHAVKKQWLEDYVIKTTWELLNDKDAIEEIVGQVCKLHESLSKDQVIIKSLISKRNDAIKASKNLIAAIEQGIITEQTKIRLKELETQISQYDFDIEQEKQRNYSYLTPDMIRDYFNSIIRGDIEDITIRKEIVRLLIREIIYDNKNLIIVYNFIENSLTRKQITDKINEVIRQSVEAASICVDCSSKHSNSAP